MQSAFAHTRASSYVLHSSHPRRGVSLLEVLISMFIILFGLLGVAALLELGRSEVVVASREDRAMACGVSALADMTARGMLNPNRWVGWYDQAPATGLGWWAPVPAPNPPWVYQLPSNQTAAWRRVGDVEGKLFGPCVIDPLYILRTITPASTPTEIANQVARFPYVPGVPAMRRLFVDVSKPGGSPLTLNVTTLAAIADRQFTWPDDQVFDIPKDPQQRPTRLFDATGAGVFEGNYSWLATVAPRSDGFVDVSVAVFYQRDFTPPSAPADPDKPGERVLAWTDSANAVQPGVQFFGGGWGGGDVRLLVDSVDSPVLGRARSPAYLDVREGDWIFVYGVSGGQSILRWYRVIAVGEEATLLNPAQPPSNTNPWTRLVTLAGPDWRIDNDNNGVPEAWGVVCTGVAGVCTETIKVDD